GVSAAVTAGVAAITVAGSGARTENRIHNTIQSRISRSNTGSTPQTGKHVTAGGALDLEAHDAATITSHAVAAAVSVELLTNNGAPVSIGAAVSTNTITDTVSSSIEDSRTTSSGGDTTVNADATSSISATPVAAVVAISGSASPASVALAGG